MGRFLSSSIRTVPAASLLSSPSLAQFWCTLPKAGRLIPSDVFGRARALEQMFFHATGIGPALGQVGFFKRQVPFAIARFQAEAERTLAVLDGILGRSEFAAGDKYTIADITHFGWLWRREFAGVDLTTHRTWLAGTT